MSQPSSPKPSCPAPSSAWATARPLAGISAIAFASAACGPTQEEVADLVLTGGTIVTVDEALPDAEALAVRDGRIAAIGSVAEIEAWVGSQTRVVDLDGRAATNGERFMPDQRLSRMEALEANTINAAYGAFEEEIKGSLTPGKLADIAILSQDILTVDEPRIPETEVEMTIVGGDIVYERGTGGS